MEPVQFNDIIMRGSKFNKNRIYILNDKELLNKDDER
jgi:hypothetical protein